MSTTTPRRGFISRFFAGVGGFLTSARNFTLNMLFLLFVLLVLSVMVSSCQQTSIPDRAALLLNPQGVVVEAPTYIDPLRGMLLGGEPTREAQLHNMLLALNAAATDDRIEMLILDLDELQWMAPAHAERLGQALAEFKQTGKKVVSYGYFYDQLGFSLASFADALYMHPMGQIVLQGFGGFNLYIKDLLEKLKVTTHIFRVGDFKSAVEPYTRNDMSPEARMDAEQLYDGLWQHVLATISDNRNLSLPEVTDYANNLPQRMAQTEGDLARAALEAHLVDELLTADQARVRMTDDVGITADGDLNAIDYRTYLQAASLSPFQPAQMVAAPGDHVAVIIAQGAIVAGGNDDANVVNMEPTLELIRRARRNPSVKALVLRVDSPGGSQFASEVIRQELELVQIAGKPVVASFGATAASGGYWISATSDAIVAEKTTITGSIGIFAMANTFENALAEIGVTPDGVGTTDLTLGMSTVGGLNTQVKQLFQAQVENGYEQFINLVARGRNMPADAVEQIAGGRVWSGEDAAEIGLVDELGGLQVAIERAATLAGLEDWTVVRLAPPLDATQLLLSQLANAMLPQAWVAQWTSLAQSPVGTLLANLNGPLTWMGRMDDPRHLYVLCESCLLPR